MQHAYDSVSQNYDFAGFPVTIRLADGTYGEEAEKTMSFSATGEFWARSGRSGLLETRHDPEKVVIFATSNNIFEIIDTWAYIDGMTLTGTGSTVGLLSYFDARITFANLNLRPDG